MRKQFGWLEGIVALCVGLVAVCGIALLLCITPFLFMLAFNVVVPVFWHGAPHLTFLQAWCAVLLMGLISGTIRVTANRKKD